MTFSILKISKWLLLLFVSVFCLTFIEADTKLHQALNYQFEQHRKIVDRMRVVDQKQLTCMAKNIFFEANSESDIGKIAVGLVVLNRVKHGFANTPCDVIYQASVVERNDEQVKVCQFSWVCDDIKTPSRSNPHYRQAEKIAKELLVGLHRGVVPSNTLFFHSISINPQWNHRVVATIGNHVFYSKQKAK
jgi:spore germination cell wall hydrolase CwlJ-like protein